MVAFPERVGSYDNLNQEEARKQYLEVHDDDKWFYTIWTFSNEVKPRDIIIAQKNRNTILGVGEVTGDYFYDTQLSIERTRSDGYAHMRPVNWINKHRFETTVNLAVLFWHEISFEKALQLGVIDEQGDVIEFEEDDTQISMEFKFENMLENFILDHFDVIFKGTLKQYKEGENEKSNQYHAKGVGSNITRFYCLVLLLIIFLTFVNQSIAQPVPLTKEDNHINEGTYVLVADNGLTTTALTYNEEGSHGISIFFSFYQNVTLTINFDRLIESDDRLKDRNLILATIPVTINATPFSTWEISTSFSRSEVNRDSVAFYYITNSNFIKIPTQVDPNEFVSLKEFFGNGTYVLLGTPRNQENIRISASLIQF